MQPLHSHLGSIPTVTPMMAAGRYQAKIAAMLQKTLRGHIQALAWGVHKVKKHLYLQNWHWHERDIEYDC